MGITVLLVFVLSILQGFTNSQMIPGGCRQGTAVEDLMTKIRNMYIDMIETKDNLKKMSSEILNGCRHNNDLKELEKELAEVKKELVETRYRLSAAEKSMGRKCKYFIFQYLKFNVLRFMFFLFYI